MPAPRSPKRSKPAGAPNPVQKPLDAVDREILTELVRDGRLPNNVLAERLGIAPSTALLRTQNLVKRGVIRGFRADVDHARVGAGLQAMVSVRVRPGARGSLMEFGKRLAQEPGVLNVYFVAGAFDFLVHVAASDTEGLRNFVTQNLSSRPETESTQTSLVFEHFPGAGIPL
jgi:DNA-binding Lrp family transcriptional regulator